MTQALKKIYPEESDAQQCDKKIFKVYILIC